jgi:hypothetical protein
MSIPPEKSQGQARTVSPAQSGDGMSRRDREDLLKLARARERVAKSGIKHRAAELLAQVEEELSAIYRERDPRWAAITDEAERVVAEADAAIAAKCRDLGIRESFRPGLHLNWWSRGENASRERRVELRRLAERRIAALAQGAQTAIERASVDVQTHLLAGGLETAAARAFLDSMPTPAGLMPPIPVAELEALMPGCQRDDEDDG